LRWLALWRTNRDVSPRVNKKSAYFMIPCARRLLEIIDCFLKFANMRWIILISEAWWLYRVNSVCEMNLEEGIIDSKLSEGPPAWDNKTRNTSKCYGFYNRTENVMIIHLYLLLKAFCNQTSFESVNWIIRVMFNTKNVLIIIRDDATIWSSLPERKIKMIKNIYKNIIEKKLVFKKYHLEQSFKQTRRLPNPLSFSWFKSIVIIFFFCCWDFSILQKI